MYRLHYTLCTFFLISILFYSLLSFNIGGKVPLISLLSPVFLIYFLFYYNFRVARESYIHFFYFFIFFVFILTSALYVQEPKLLIQLSVYVFVPMIFYIIGYNNEQLLVLKVMKFAILVSFISAVSYFLFLGYGINGPFGIFSIITDASFSIQEGWNSRILYARSSGLYPDPNTLALFSGISLLFIYYYRDKLSTYEFFLYLGLAIVCLLLSMSRGTILSLLVTFIIVEARRVFRGNFKLSTLILLFLIVCSFFSLSMLDLEGTRFSRLSSVFDVIQGNTSDGNLDSRTVAWSGVLNYVSDNVFGTLLPPQLVLELSPDSQVFYFLAQGGVLLCATFIFYFIYLFLQSFLMSKENSFLLGIIVFVYINSITMVVFNNFLVSFLWFVIGREVILKRIRL